MKPSKTRLVNGMPSKILFLDIETKPAKVYTFRMWDTSINPEQVIEPGGTICVGAKWMGSKETIFFSDWDHGHETMLREVHALITEADAIVTYNGDKFDLPKLWGEFLLNGMKPPQPPTSIDILKAVKKLGFDMNRLAYIGPLLKIGKKLKHEGFGLWRSVMEGDAKAQGRMEKYCVQDVVLLEKLYKVVKPFIKNHPHLGDKGGNVCGACGSKHVQSRGHRRTKFFKIQRLQCQTCGSWSEGSREKIKVA